ncbi:hypothetical protein [Mailhella sp.]
MNASDSVRSSLPLVAAALTEQTGIEIEIGGSAAYTSGKVVHLPALPLDVDETLVGVARGYLDHELAHCIYTDFKVVAQTKGELVRWFTNLFEVIRVERLMADRYVGCGENFQALSLHAFSKKQRGDDAPEVLPMNFCLLYLRAWLEPGLERRLRLTQKKLESVAPGLPGQLVPILDEAKTGCDSTEKAVEYAKRVADILKGYQPPQIQKPEKEEAKSEEQGSTNEDNAEAESRDEASGADDASAPFSALFGKGAEKSFPRNLGEHLATELEKKTSKTGGSVIQVAKEVPNGFASLDTDRLVSAYAVASALRTRLVGKLQTHTLDGMRSAEFGRLNPRRLWRSAVNDGHVFQKRQPKVMEATAVHILLDVSGSTNKIIDREVQSAFALVKALQNVRGVSCGVSAFPVAYLDSYFEGTPGISWLVRHGERVDDSFPDVRFYGMTPLAEAVWWATGQMRRLRQKRKLLVIFTDGFPDSVDSAAKALEDARACGIEVYGIGYQHPNIRDLIADSSVIDDIDQLPEALESMLSAKLKKRAVYA